MAKNNKRSLVVTENHGGLSTDLKQGPQHSFAYSRGIDFRKSPTALTFLPRTVKESGSVVVDLITEMVRLPSGKIIAIGDAGHVYSRSTSGTWTDLGTLSSGTAYGAVYNLQTDTVYISNANALSTVSNADGRFSGGSVTLNDNAITFNTDQSATTTGNTYTTTGSITETSANKLTFTPTVEPLISLTLTVASKGTGDLVVTMHDQANNNLGSVTIANASVSVGTNTFTFATPVRTTVAPNATQYHFHITHPSGTASTITTATSADFSTAVYNTSVNRLVSTQNGFHPIKEFVQYICIGNGRYLTTWEVLEQTNIPNSQFQRHRLVFPSGYEVTSLAIYTEYLAIAVEKRSSSSSNSFQEGKIYFWDGVSLNYNFQIDITEGAPYGLFSDKNILYYYAGGALYGWSAGNPVKIYQMPNTDSEYTDATLRSINYPNTMTTRGGVLMSIFPSETTSTTIEHGIYSYGARNHNYKNSIGYSYVMSTGTKTNGAIKLGCVKSYGDTTFLSWKDGSDYGVDTISPTSDPSGTAVWESLVLDNGLTYRQKQATYYKIDFSPLPTGATITPKYKIDRASDWTTGTAAVAGDTSVTLNIDQRYREIQLGWDGVATTTTPEILSSTLVWDPLLTEED